MAKVIKFDAGKAVFGKEFAIVDTFDNVQLVNKGVRRILEAIDKYDTDQNNSQKPSYLYDYQDIIAPLVIDEAGKLLGLSKEETKKLKGISYSEVFNFYKNAAQDFVSISIPSMELLSGAFKSLATANDEEFAKQSPKDEEAK